MAKAGAQLMTWSGAAMAAAPRLAQRCRGLGALFANHIPDYAANLINSCTTTKVSK